MKMTTVQSQIMMRRHEFWQGHLYEDVRIQSGVKVVYGVKIASDNSKAPERGHAS